MYFTIGEQFYCIQQCMLHSLVSDVSSGMNVHNLKPN